MTKEEAQRRRWTFYEAVKNPKKGGAGSPTQFPAPCDQVFSFVARSSSIRSFAERYHLHPVAQMEGGDSQWTLLDV